MGWERALITDSGGFQVFSLAHGNVADEIKGRRGGAGLERRRCWRSPSAGSRFRSYLDGSERFMGPEESMAVQAALGSDIALAFDECTPYHADRDYTARSTERTHRWLDRCLEWHAEHGPAAPGGVRDRPGRRARGPAPRVGRGGGRRRRRRDRDRRHARPRQGRDARGARDDRCRCCRRRRPSTCSGSASPTTCSPESGAGSTSSTAPCPPASPATAWRSRRCPTRGSASTSRSAALRRPTRARWSRAAPARPAPPTRAPTCTT